VASSGRSIWRRALPPRSRRPTFNFETGRIEKDGQPPGYFGSALELSTGYEYFFDADGVVYSVEEFDTGTFLGVFNPTDATLRDTVPLDEGGEFFLFDIDPETGVASNFRDIRAASGRYFHLFAIAYVPEPAPGLLPLAGLVALARRRSHRAS